MKYVEYLVYGENLVLFWMMLNKASAYLYILGNEWYLHRKKLLDKYLSVYSEQ